MGPHRTIGEGQGYRLALTVTNQVRYLVKVLCYQRYSVAVRLHVDYRAIPTLIP